MHGVSQRSVERIQNHKIKMARQVACALRHIFRGVSAIDGHGKKNHAKDPYVDKVPKICYNTKLVYCNLAEGG